MIADIVLGLQHGDEAKVKSPINYVQKAITHMSFASTVDAMPVTPFITKVKSL